jgi:hypothetical protein
MDTQDGNNANWIEAYRPFFFEEISGITNLEANQVLLCDKSRGMLTEVNLISQTETFRKRYDTNDYAEVSSISYYDGKIYSVYRNKIYVANYRSDSETLKTKLLTEIPKCSDLTGIAVTQEKIYLVTEKQTILAYNRKTEEIETIGKAKGIGLDDLCYFQDNLLILDCKEQTLYVFDLETREFLYEILTPFENPTAIAAVYHEKAQREVLYVAYSRPTFEVYDTGDSEFKLKLDSPISANFIYPLVFQHNQAKKAILSNGFLVEMYYVEKLHALPEIVDKHKVIKNLDWKISLPMDTDRQKLISIEPIGDFQMKIEEIEKEENRKVAVFSIPEVNLETERRVFGWKAVIQVSGIKYYLKEEDVREISDEELKKYAKYLKNEDQLDMNRHYVQDAAKEAIAHLSKKEQKNILKKAQSIRNYIYDKLTYVMDQYHDGTEDVLRNREGSCGEYLNVFLSLFRLNDIPTRKCGNYKVPAYKMQAGSRSVFLSPDFNHVWLQFYIPDLGWVPLESSADDEASTSREWAKRYFMALAWYHLECRMGSYFEEVFYGGTNKPFFLTSGDLAKSDIKFKVIDALDSH